MPELSDYSRYRRAAPFSRRPELDSRQKRQHRPTLKDSNERKSGVRKLVSTVRSRPNYYEILGIKPTAAGDEIAQAFARESSVFRPHSFGGVAEVCMAYATLRDPIKRRSYDASIGVRPEPEPQPRQWTVGPREATSSTQLIAARPLQRSRSEEIRPAAPLIGSRPLPEPLATQTPAPDPVIQPQPQIGGRRLNHLALPSHMAVEVRPIDWKRTGMVLGGVVVAACFLGGLAGWWSAADVGDSPPPEQAASLSIPSKETPPATDAPWPGSVRSVARPQADLPRRAEISRPRLKRAAMVPPSSGPVEQPSDSQTPATPPVPSQLAEASEPEAATVPAAAPVATGLPLPNRVVARTIDRIGYSCGGVASTSPVEGEAPGVFKVTCTSGQSYQAKPVNGRYRFRRLGKL
jgi:hypothetical protein